MSDAWVFDEFSVALNFATEYEFKRVQSISEVVANRDIRK